MNNQTINTTVISCVIGIIPAFISLVGFIMNPRITHRIKQKETKFQEMNLVCNDLLNFISDLTSPDSSGIELVKKIKLKISIYGTNTQSFLLSLIMQNSIKMTKKKQAKEDSIDFLALLFLLFSVIRYETFNERKDIKSVMKSYLTDYETVEDCLIAAYNANAELCGAKQFVI